MTEVTGVLVASIYKYWVATETLRGNEYEYSINKKTRTR